MDLGLADKRALVLSSSGGLGFAIARALAAEGARVIITGRDAARLEARAREMAGADLAGIAADLTKPADVARLARQAEATWGGIDVLVNNTPGPPAGAVSQVTDDAWLKQFEAMVLSLMRITNAVLPGMRARRWGRVITVTSSSVIQPIPGLGLSNTLRSALVGWSKTLSGEVAADGVTVNTVLPGRIHTARVDALDAAAAKRQGMTAEEAARASQATIPLGRYGRPEEFAAVVAFLAGEPASYVTGCQIRIDGGMIRSV